VHTKRFYAARSVGTIPNYIQCPAPPFDYPGPAKKKLLELYVREHKTDKSLVLYISELFKSRAFRKYHPHVCSMPQKKFEFFGSANLEHSANKCIICIYIFVVWAYKVWDMHIHVIIA
jgi:hypothetical protein